MKVSKLLMSLIAITMIITLLTACGGGSSSSSSGSSQQASRADADDDEDGDVSEYEALMSECIDRFKALMASLDELMGETQNTSSGEELVQWCQSYMQIKETIGEGADALAGIAEQAPEEYRESHVKVTVAAAAVYDALTGFEYAVDAALNEDEEAFSDGLADFIGNMLGASQLWAEAVQ